MLKLETIIAQPENEPMLVVSWFDYDPFMRLSFETYFFNIIEHINQFDVKKLVLDCSFRRHSPSEDDFREIFELFFSGLSATKLEKLARICPPDPVKSLKYNRLLERIKDELNLRFELRNFKNKESAFSWIKEQELVAVIKIESSNKKS